VREAARGGGAGGRLLRGEGLLGRGLHVGL
jgi:hypothetical protein